METRTPLTSPDGSSNGSTPERCPHPLYSIDGLFVVKVEPEEDLYIGGDEPCKEDEIPPVISTDLGDTRDTQTEVKAEEEEEGHNENMVKAEVKEEAEESYMMGDDVCKDEEIHPEISTAAPLILT
ncbi:hypothetical protein AB205_0115030, partial [Aquarana catesbeiana]